MQVHPAVAIIAILVGAELAGVLGALLAIPTAATIGVLIDEGRGGAGRRPAPPSAGAGPGVGSSARAGAGLT